MENESWQNQSSWGCQTGEKYKTFRPFTFEPFFKLVTLFYSYYCELKSGSPTEDFDAMSTLLQKPFTQFWQPLNTLMMNAKNQCDLSLPYCLHHISVFIQHWPSLET